MGSDVVLTAALRNNLLSLQNTQRNIDATQLRLATGLKVNSALDNPQNFFTSQSLSNRASDLSRLLDGINSSIRTIEEANNGVTALSSLVNQAESVALEALSDIRSAEGFARIRGDVDLSDVQDLVNDLGGGGIIDNGDTFTVAFTDGGTQTGTATITISSGDVVQSIVAAINSDTAINDYVRARVTNSGQIEIRSLIEGGIIRIQDDTATATQLGVAGFTALGLDTIIGTENDGSTGTVTGGTAVAGGVLTSAAANASTLTQVNGDFVTSATLEDAGFLAGSTDSVNITLSIDGTVTQTAALTGLDTIQSLLDEINTNAAFDGVVTATFDADTGQISLEFEDGVGRVELQLDSTGGTTPAFGFGTGATDGAIAAGQSISEQFVFVGSSVDLEQFESDFNNIRDQIDGLVEDANFRGVNLLSGDNLVTFFNEDRDNSLTTEGIDFTSLGLGIESAAFTDETSVQSAIDQARAALESVRNFGTSIANDLTILQTRRDFTEQTINTLESGADDLIVADQNEEGANLLALQTRQQLGVTSLSLAAQSQQSVLRLF